MTLNANTSGTYAFDPNLGAAVIAAYARCGVRRTELVAQHMADAEAEANYVMSDWQADGLNPFQVTLVSQNIVAGQSTYTIPNTTVFTLDIVIRQNADTSNPIDRLIIPISRSDYMAIANKEMQGFPTSAWINLQLDPVMVLWPVPNQDLVGGLRYYVQRRPQDMKLANGTEIAIPYQMYDAFVWALAERLAVIYAPDKVAILSPMAAKSYQRMLQATTENVPVTMGVQLGSYFRI